MAASATHIRAPAETTVPGGFLYLSLVITVYIKSVLSDVCTATPNSFTYCVHDIIVALMGERFIKHTSVNMKFIVQE